MTIEKEIIGFENYDNLNQVDKLLHQFENKTKTYANMFNLASIENHVAAACYIYEQSVKENIKWDMENSIKLVVKYNSHEILQHLISKNVQFDNFNALIAAIDNNYKPIIEQLFKHFKYDTNQLSTLFNHASNNMNACALSFIYGLDSSYKTDIHKINETLKVYAYDGRDYEDEDIDTIIQLINLGGNAQLFNNSQSVFDLIMFGEFKNVAQFLLAGVKLLLTKNTLAGLTIEYITNDNDIKNKLTGLNQYMLKHYPNKKFDLKFEK